MDMGLGGLWGSSGRPGVLQFMATAEFSNFAGILCAALSHPDPSSKATLWVKAQHEGALPPPCIVRKKSEI